jgi:hypothetical protein
VRPALLRCEQQYVSAPPDLVIGQNSVQCPAQMCHSSADDDTSDHCLGGVIMRRLSALFLVVLFASTAHAEKAALWKKVGDWQVRVDRSLSNGCFIIAAYTKGEIVRFGFDPSEQNGGLYVLINSDSWKSLVKGKSYSLEYKFDEDSPWRGDFLATDMGLYGKSNKPNFLIDFAAKRILTISYEGRFVARLPLTGSQAAIKEMWECQRAMLGQSAQGSSDPFAAEEQNARDPFAGRTRPAVNLDPFASR